MSCDDRWEAKSRLMTWTRARILAHPVFICNTTSDSCLGRIRAQPREGKVWFLDSTLRDVGLYSLDTLRRGLVKRVKGKKKFPRWDLC